MSSLSYSPLVSSNSNSNSNSDNDQQDDMLFEIEEYLCFTEADTENGHSLSPAELHKKPFLQTNTAPVHATCTNKSKNLLKKINRGMMKIAFRTKSELEILDDGYKWRKYGKKMVKDSPNPRNYYRCSYDGCNVKKRVERQREDPSYVITTYEGVHNHQAPSASTMKHHQGSSYSLPFQGLSP